MNQFSVNEIVCLKHKNKSLYCEVIDIIKSRSMLWARPVMLVDMSESDYFDVAQEQIYDLRLGSDLLWYLKNFSPVLDTEYINFLSKLKEPIWNEKESHLARKKLRFFLEEIYQT